MAASGMDGDVANNKPLHKATKAFEGLYNSGTAHFIITKVTGKCLRVPIMYTEEGHGGEGEDWETGNTYIVTVLVAWGY